MPRISGVKRNYFIPRPICLQLVCGARMPLNGGHETGSQGYYSTTFENQFLLMKIRVALAVDKSLRDDDNKRRSFSRRIGLKFCNLDCVVTSEISHRNPHFLDRLARFMMRLVVLMVLTFLTVALGVSAARRLIEVDSFAKWRLQRDGYALDNESVHRALESGDTLALTRLKVVGVPLDRPDHTGKSPFQKAILNDRVDMMQCLADLGLRSIFRGLRDALLKSGRWRQDRWRLQIICSPVEATQMLKLHQAFRHWFGRSERRRTKSLICSSSTALRFERKLWRAHPWRWRCPRRTSGPSTSSSNWVRTRTD